MCEHLSNERWRCNLKVIDTLKKDTIASGLFRSRKLIIKIGLVAAALGATSIERHITLDRAMYGSDQSASISVETLKNFAQSLRAVKKIRWWKKKF